MKRKYDKILKRSGELQATYDAMSRNEIK
jgi:hypothetical protein